MVASERNSSIFTHLKMKVVVQRNCLQDGFNFVIAVGTFAEDLQTPVDLGKGRKT
jgi:hypothetical protein